MAGKSALAAGAARAKEERAKRSSTPLIGTEPVEVVAAEAAPPARRDRAAARSGTRAAKSTAGATTRKPTEKPTATPRSTRAAKAPAAAQRATPTRATSAKAASAPTAAPPVKRAHRPAPVVTSAPSPKASRQSGERRAVPRLSPRAKRLADERAGQRAHLSVAPPPDLPPVDHDSFTAEAFGGERERPRSSSPLSQLGQLAQLAGIPLGALGGLPGVSGLPTPDIGALVSGLVTALRTSAQLVGMAPEDIEVNVAQVLAYLRRRLDGDYSVDDFGFDADFTDSVFYPMLRPIYQKWFRVEVRGIDNIPDDSGALVVANHSGTIAIDSLMLQLAIHDEHPRHRALRALGADLVFQTPFLGTMARRAGATLATNADAERLFAQGELVGVFPEGFKGVGKPFKDRYKLQRFGRGGFVSAALRAQVPIIPVAIVGAEEIAPIIGNMPTVARLLGLPYAPITPTFPLLGPLGLIPLPSKWIIAFGEPIPTDTYGPDAAEDPMLVFELTDLVRETIQQSLHSALQTRRSVFF